MGVNIDIDLRATNARRKVESLRQEIRSLEDSLDVELGFDDDLDDIADSLDNFTTKVEDLRMELDGLEADLSETLSELDTAQIGVEMPDGTTGATGGENDPPQTFNIRTEGLKKAAPDGGTTDFNARKVARRIESRFGLSSGAISRDALRDMSIEEMNAEISEFIDRSGRNPFPNQGLLFANRDTHDLLLGDNGRFFDAPNARDLSDQMFTGSGSVKMRMEQKGDAIPDTDMRKVAGMTRQTASSIGDVLKNTRRFKGADSILDSATDSLRRFGGVLKRLKPSMRRWWQLLAMFLPLLIAVGVQVAGVASAMLGLAAAAGAIIGMGLLGHADQMGESFRQAKLELRDLKSDLFETFQGPMQLFAPIQSELFDWLPGQLLDVADAMEGLIAYEGTIFELFRALSGGAAEFFDILTRNEGIISQLGTRFGGLLGSGLLDAFEWLIQTAYKNQEVLIDLGGVIIDVLTVLYNLSMGIGRLAAILRPVFSVLAALSALLNNQFVAALLFVVGAMGAVALAATKVILSMAKLQLAMQILGIGGSQAIAAFASTAVGSLQSIAASAWSAWTALSAVQKALVMTGVGALLVGGGIALSSIMQGAQPPGVGGGAGPSDGGRSGYRGGQQVVYNDNRQYTIQNEGQMDTASEQRIRSTIDQVNTEGTAMAPPDAGVNGG